MTDLSTLSITATVIDPDQIKALCDLTQLTVTECYDLGYDKLQALIERIKFNADVR